MDSRSVFFDEWLRSLREQYKHVVRSNDMVTLPTLTAVMQNVGFGEEELAQLRVEATMHVDDVAEDFKPDMQILDPVPAPHPAECLCPQCMTIDEAAHDADGQPVAPDQEAASADTGHTFAVAPLNPADDEEPDPLTFEDSLDTRAGIDDAEADAPRSADDESADADDDPDAPAQMSLF